MMLTAHVLITLGVVGLIISCLAALVQTAGARPEAGSIKLGGGPHAPLAVGQRDSSAPPALAATEHASPAPSAPAFVVHGAEGGARGVAPSHVARFGSWKTHCGLPLEAVDCWSTRAAPGDCPACVAAAAESQARQVA